MKSNMRENIDTRGWRLSDQSVRTKLIIWSCIIWQIWHCLSVFRIWNSSFQFVIFPRYGRLVPIEYLEIFQGDGRDAAVSRLSPAPHPSTRETSFLLPTPRSSGHWFWTRFVIRSSRCGQWWRNHWRCDYGCPHYLSDWTFSIVLTAVQGTVRSKK